MRHQIMRKEGSVPITVESKTLFPSLIDRVEFQVLGLRQEPHECSTATATYIHAWVTIRLDDTEWSETASLLRVECISEINIIDGSAPSHNKTQRWEDLFCLSY